MPETEQKQRTRKVTKKAYLVEVDTEQLRSENAISTWKAVAKAEDTRSGQKWIADHGEDGKHYRVIAVTYSATVKVQQVTKRVLG